MHNLLSWLHISDIHFNPKTEWRDSLARESLLLYLEDLFKKNKVVKPDLIFCTGDIAFGENDKLSLSNQYDQAKVFFDSLLNICGQDGAPLPKDRLFVVPGNHDINRKNVNNDAQETLTRWAKESNKYHSTINQRFEERPQEFKDAIKRLEEYSKFISDYLPHQHDVDGRQNYSYVTNIDRLKVGIAGFNSAWTCSGPEDDRTLWLAAEWQFNDAQHQLKDADIRIGLIHHPVDWLNPTEQDLVTRRISTDFHFWLHGHSHNAWVVPAQSHITVAAGAVSANTTDEFGINLTSINLSEFTGTIYLHKHRLGGTSWTIAPVEVHAPDGQWLIANLPNSLFKIRQTLPPQEMLPEINFPEDGEINNKPLSSEFFDRIFSSRLDEALESFSSQPKVWVDPIVAFEPEVSKDAGAIQKITIPELIADGKSIVISAPPQFGLTCLAHYIIREAWRSSPSSMWLYLDVKNLKPNPTNINKAIRSELNLFGCDITAIKCVVVDSWSCKDKNNEFILNEIHRSFINTKIIVMQSIDNNPFVDCSFNINATREFIKLYLWALPRNSVRKVVSTYISTKYIGDEDAVTTKVVNDLNVLNMHRTPYNCLTLLKALEIKFDESPVNRCEMIKQVLFVLFNVDDIPTYKVRPDLKDTEYVLGYFCENVIKNSGYYFTRKYFLDELSKYCKESIIDLEVQVVFDVLKFNNIIIQRGDQFCFRFSYWIYYFAAQRMHHNKDFAEFILKDQKYASYPEIIEFYTGIDRRREDALVVMIGDLKKSSDKVQEKCGLPDGLNPYRFAKWRPTPAALEHMKNEIADGVKSSNLPASIKDDYADRLYDRARPYDQEIRNLLTEHSLVYMVQTMKAGARALRNSDYVKPEIKRELLNEILHCWEQVSKVLITLLPPLISKGQAIFGGYNFFLSGDFGSSPEDRLHNILRAMPANIVNWYEDDLFSQKMGPLLYDRLNNETNALTKHKLILMVINQKPREWRLVVQHYIASIKNDSFYLLDTFEHLRSQYRYSFATPQNLADLKYLIKMAIAKHEAGGKIPSLNLISSNKFDKCVPTRDVDSD